MHGALIYPDGRTLYLEKSHSHRYMLENTPYGNDVKSAMSSHPKLLKMVKSGEMDIVEASMMLGFVRVMVFSTQMAVEYTGRMTDVQKNRLLEMFSRNDISTVVLEDFITHEVRQFDDIDDFSDFIDSE